MPVNRRTLLALGAPLGLGACRVGAVEIGPDPPPAATGGSPLFPDDPEFWFETLRMFGAADYGGSQFGEVLEASSRIKAGDYDSWHAAWSAAADRVSAEAGGQLARGHTVSARDGLLRASNYYRNAEFFLHADPTDPRIARAYARSVECYRTAASLFEPPIVPVEIPYQGTTLPGYFHAAGPGSRPRATVILHTGFDGSAEEMHFMGARAAVERGLNALVFDGPGQFGPLHRQGLHFRPDWEQVVSPVVDFALRLPGVDPRRVALMGVSMGGELAPRAAAFEKRIAALVANDGVYDCAEPYLALAPPAEREAFIALLKADEAPAIDHLLENAVKESPTARWAFTHGMWAMGVKSPRAYVAATLEYNLRNGVAEAISCPTLICDAGDDLFTRGQPQELFEHLTCRKTMIRFIRQEGAAAHCQVDASRLAFGRIYDWLEETLG